MINYKKGFTSATEIENDAKASPAPHNCKIGIRSAEYEQDLV